MTIVYALIARGKAVLAEFTATAGNFPTVTRVLLNKIPPEATRMSYVSCINSCFSTCTKLIPWTQIVLAFTTYALQLCAVTCIWVLCRTKQNSNNNRYQ